MQHYVSTNYGFSLTVGLDLKIRMYHKELWTIFFSGVVSSKCCAFFILLERNILQMNNT
jgi:hypothetical protein